MPMRRSSPRLIQGRATDPATLDGLTQAEFQFAQVLARALAELWEVRDSCESASDGPPRPPQDGVDRISQGD
ncbi:MAG TPA: hypothetical protein VGG64_11845 [Pirellulales bacterium]|jgi:hypothetical protein